MTVNSKSSRANASKDGRYTPDLRGFIGLCEFNYVRLLRLLPNLHDEDERTFGVDGGQGDTADLQRVRILVVERSPYTTTVTLFQESHLKEWVPEPTMTVRLYHDARMAEVLEFQRSRQIRPQYPYPNQRMYQRDEKAQINAFLGEWLEYCLRSGCIADTVRF